MNRVKLAMLAGTALCLGVGSAEAAGMADPWVGYYVGGNIGYSWGTTDAYTKIAPFEQANFQNNFFSYSFPGGSSVTTLHPDGLIGGGQIGYIERLAPHWLIGFEADLQWSGEKDRRPGGFAGNTRNCTSGDCSFNNLGDITARLNWFGTMRARAGYDWNGLWFYGTAGVAVGGLSASGTNTLTLFDNVSQSVVGLYSSSFRYSTTELGWVAGFGTEGLIGDGRWRWKFEYLHMEFNPDTAWLFGGPPSGIVSLGRFTDEIVRVGFNYRFSP